MSYLTIIRRAQAENQTGVQAAAPTVEDLPTEVVQAVATHVVAQAALAEQVEQLWAPRAATADDPLAVLGQTEGADDANHGWSAVIAGLPMVAGAIKVEIAPPTPQAAAEWAFLK